MAYARLFSPETLLGALDVDGRLEGLPFSLSERRLKLLGAGCNGLVVEMCADGDGRPYAVKFVNSPSMSAELGIHRLAAAAGLAPPLHGGGAAYQVADNWCAMPMERIDTVPLEGRHAGEVELLVSRLHALNVSHGDVKPSNFLAAAARVYISDFGCSVNHDGHAGDQPSLLVGDPCYMPPISAIKAKGTREKAFEIDEYSLCKTLKEIKKA